MIDVKTDDADWVAAGPSESELLDHYQGAFNEDDGYTHQTWKVVKTRSVHKCIWPHHDGNGGWYVHDIPIGSRAVRETAIVPDIGRRSMYAQLSCIEADWMEEYSE